jgi:hypothetical protein
MLTFARRRRRRPPPAPAAPAPARPSASRARQACTAHTKPIHCGGRERARSRRGPGCRQVAPLSGAGVQPAGEPRMGGATGHDRGSESCTLHAPQKSAWAVRLECRTVSDSRVAVGTPWTEWHSRAVPECSGGATASDLDHELAQAQQRAALGGGRRRRPPPPRPLDPERGHGRAAARRAAQRRRAPRRPPRAAARAGSGDAAASGAGGCRGAHHTASHYNPYRS